MKVTSQKSFGAELRQRLLGATNIAIVGVGYELGRDDNAGLAIAQKIKTKLPDLPIYLTGSAPENYTGPIIKERPSHVIFIDAAALESKPGDIAFIDKEEIKGARFSTHTLPLAIIMDYFEMSIGAKSFAIGIQPFSEGFGDELSTEMQEIASNLSEMISQEIKTVLKI